ncbi:MAG: 16S rRNA (adenine1518-N6/adenine1519-N6)-dimethyltransferase [Parcubacteria group bacterium Gr01-1014_46]|nr:MAG: 16S rRNA (adenine1518-N6/adenine1519-N6)-dimethyltransferase [Parcubacteria group bacterium Gr01-1014_46]
MLKKKSLGQNFLKSPKVVSDIISAGKVKGNDTVLEIGPGEGVMTTELLKTGANVICIEKDDRLIPILQNKFSKEIALGQLILIHEDILKLNLPKSDFSKKGGYKVVANIPYYITGQIIRMFLESENKPTSMTLLVQKEVAERIVARDKKESLLSLSVKVFGDPKIIRVVGRGAFNPAPNVDSAVINIENISKEKLDKLNPKFFFEVIHAGFAHKRKQLLPNLANNFEKEKIVKAFEDLEMDLKIRAEDVSLEKWIKLAKLLTK